jgi:hypothetical protein
MQRRKTLSRNKNFGRFFTDVQPYNRQPHQASQSRGRELKFGHESMYLGDYLTARNGNDRAPFSHLSRIVNPTAETERLVTKHMVGIDNDTLYYELIIFADQVHVYVKHNKILGSRLLAKVTIESLPQCILDQIAEPVEV